MNKKYNKYFFETKEYNQAIRDLEDFIFENEQSNRERWKTRKQ